jgi:Na+-translocating ferredoxin:NAD+ oxidoreductase RnfD subunit
MKVGSHHLGRMYLVTIALLVILAGIGAYGARTFPSGLVVAVVSCVLIELVIVKINKQKMKVPLAAIITGLIIGSVAPISVSLIVVIAASLIAEITKFFLKSKARNILNPAAVGLLVALALFGTGDEWWAAPSIHIYGLLIPLAVVLIVAAYEARRIPTVLVATAIMAVGFTALAGSGFSAAAVLVALLSVNYYFVFLMVADPKTSPNRMSGQLVYGIGIALFALGFTFLRMPYPLLVTLVIANLLYAGFRKFGTVKSVAAAAVATS